MLKIIVYADGLNLYHTLHGFNPQLMWLDVLHLVKIMLGDRYDIAHVNYYTARFSANNPIAAGQQATYHKALASQPQVTIHRGYFKRVPKRGKLTANNAVPPSVSASLPDLLEIETREEKKTDVTLATHLVRDAFCKQFEVAAVITNDGDFEEAMRVVTKEAQLPVYLLSPAGLVRPKRLKRRHGTQGGLLKEATHTIHITKSHLETAQFPRMITLANGKRIIRPSAWG